MNIVIYVNYKLNCIKDCSNSFVLIFFSNLIFVIVLNVFVISSNILVFEFVVKC